MTLYDFKALSPYEFEILVQDLLQEEFNIRLESFKEGKDQGVDLRYCKDANETIIVQCKRMDCFSNLISTLKKEIKKVKLLKPKNYILVTSLPLSRENKRKIMELFCGTIKRQKDIFGREDLNNLIRRYPNIEKKHFKLWLTSVNIIDEILHNNINNRSKDTIEVINSKICRFVPNESFIKSEKILDDKNYVVISGGPGIGKTTLAEFLIWQYLAKGFELIEVSHDIEEAWSKLKPDSEKQVFYYDDFLGKTNFIRSLNKNEDKRLIHFIEKIQKSKNKKFILTTREYILNQSKIEYEYIDNYPLSKCIIPLEDYTKEIRAKILYNHLYFSDIDKAYVDEIIKDNRYLEIIAHENYNLRIIDMLTETNRLVGIEAKDFFAKFINALDDPSEIWNHIYNKLDPASKSILLAIMSANFYLSFLDNLFIAAGKFHEQLIDKKLNRIDFKRSLKILEGDFIKINKITYSNGNTKTSVNFTNPSVQDFLEAKVVKEDELNLILMSLYLPKQLEYFYYTFLKKCRDKKIITDFIKIIDTVYEESDSKSLWDVIKKAILKIKAIDLSGDKNLFSLLKPDLDVILTSAHYSDQIDELFDEIEFIDIDGCKVIKEFVYKYKEKLFKDFEIDECITLDERATAARFVSLFDFAFTDSEIKEIKENFSNTNDDLIYDIRTSDVFVDFYYDIEDKLKSLMEFSSFSKNDIEHTIQYLREYHAELEEESETEYNNSLNSEEKSGNIGKMQDMSDDEIINMFKGLT